LNTLIMPTPKLRILVGVLLGALILSGCGNMRDQPKYQSPYDASPNFGSAAREIPPEAVPIGFLYDDNEHLNYGTVDGEFADTFPFVVTRADVEEGRRWFEGFCSACHGYDGSGDGVTSAEGYPQPAPASYHEPELRDQPVGYYFDVITNGTLNEDEDYINSGKMFSYASRVPVEARWQIIAYIRALQLSQNVPFEDLPADMQESIGSE